MLTWLLILLCVFAGSAGDVLCAKGMSSHGEVTYGSPSGFAKVVRAVVTRKLIILGFACDAISFFALLALLSVAQLSIAVPATALSFVVDTLGAHFFLHENVHWKRWLGVLCVTAGVVLTVESGPSKALIGSRAPATAAVQTNQHQAGNNQTRASGFDHQRPLGKVFLEPGRTPAGDGVGAQKDHHVTYSGDGLDHGGVGTADREDHQE